MAETWRHRRPRLLNPPLTVQLFLRAALVILVHRCRDVETVVHPRKGLRPNGRVGLCVSGKSNVGELVRKLYKCRLGPLRNQRDPPLHATLTLGPIYRYQLTRDCQIHQHRPKVLLNPLGTVIRQNTPHLTVNTHELLDGGVPCPESANNGRAALVPQEHGPPEVGVVIQELHEVLCNAGELWVRTGQVHEDTLKGTRGLARGVDDYGNSTLDRLRRGTVVAVLLNPGLLDTHLLGGLVQGFDVCVAKQVAEVVHVHAGRRAWPHHHCYHRGGLRAGIIIRNAGCLDKIPSTELLEPHSPAKHRSPRSVQNDLMPLLHPIERHDIESQAGHNGNVRERHTHVLFTVQIEVQVPIKIYRHTLAVFKHEIPLPRTRLPSVVDAIPERDAMDDSTSVPKNDRRTRVAVGEKGGDCGHYLTGGVGGDGTNKLQREETSVNSPAITAEKSSRKGATSVPPVTSGTPPPVRHWSPPRRRYAAGQAAAAAPHHCTRRHRRCPHRRYRELQ